VATNSTVVDVKTERAFQLLEDPRSLRVLVVGARKIRRFDPAWPDTGTALQHSVGVPPFVLRDRTVVTECIPVRRLVLEARIRPVGTFLATFEFEPHPSGCTLAVEEHAVGGLCALPGINQVADRLIGLRNAELCRRFRRLAERREQLAAAAPRHA
jgi:hypothetical protein